MNIYIQICFTSSLAGGNWSGLQPGRFTLGEIAPGTPWVGGWVDPRAGLDDEEKKKILDPTGTRTPTPRSVAIPTTLSRLLKTYKM
jgi:hypothetical protein